MTLRSVLGSAWLRAGASLGLVLAAGCAGAQAHYQNVQQARSACYQQDPGIVYQEAYAVLKGTYPIMRESERRGYIETDFAEVNVWGTQTRQKVDAEVMGDSCVRLVLKVSGQSWDANSNQWVADNMKTSEDDLYLKIHKRVMQHPVAAAPAPAPAPAAAAQPAPAPQPAPQPTSAQKPVGAEGGACYGNGTCNSGLTCASSLCVRL